MNGRVGGGGGRERHSKQVIRVSPWSLPIIQYQNEYNYSLLRWPHTKKIKRPQCKSNQTTFCRPENSSYKIIFIRPKCSAHVFLVLTHHSWTKLGYETTWYETIVRKKRLDTLLKSKIFSTVLNKCPLSYKRPPRICFFLNHPYSVSVMALLGYMYVEINRGSSSFHCSHVTSLQKQ